MELGNQYLSSVATPQGWWVHSCVADRINICHSHKGYWIRIELVAWASCEISKIVGCAYARNAGNVFPASDFNRKRQNCDPGMHHGTCVTHVPWCSDAVMQKFNVMVTPPMLNSLWGTGHMASSWKYCFRWWVVSWSAPRHYLNICCGFFQLHHREQTLVKSFVNRTAAILISLTC